MPEKPSKLHCHCYDVLYKWQQRDAMIKRRLTSCVREAAQNALPKEIQHTHWPGEYLPFDIVHFKGLQSASTAPLGHVSPTNLMCKHLRLTL